MNPSPAWVTSASAGSTTRWARASSSSCPSVDERRKTLRTAPVGQHLVPRQQVRGLGVGPVEAVLHAQRAAAPRPAPRRPPRRRSARRRPPRSARSPPRPASRGRATVRSTSSRSRSTTKPPWARTRDPPAVEGHPDAVEQARAAAGHSHDGDAGVPAGVQRRPGARADLPVGVQQRAVEVGGDELRPPVADIAEVDHLIRPGQGAVGLEHLRPRVRSCGAAPGSAPPGSSRASASPRRRATGAARPARAPSRRPAGAPRAGRRWCGRSRTACR